MYVQAVVLGAVEAATEFLPVSSTGHLILAGKLLGFEGPGSSVFEVAIQAGAIAAICVLYIQKLWRVLVGLPGDVQARKFAVAVLLAFLPAVVLGLLLHDFIKSVLFSPLVVCWSLLIGGVVMLVVERYAPKAKVHSVESMGPLLAVKIGVLQCLAMIPGVSRSASSILGALWLGVDRKTATEFSFFLAIPTLVGACALDLFKARHELTGEAWGLIAVGLITAFVVALPVVRWFIGYVSKHGFAPFAYYRMALGVVGLIWLWVAG